MKTTNKSEKEKLQPDSIRIITKKWEQDLPGTWYDDNEKRRASTLNKKLKGPESNHD